MRPRDFAGLRAEQNLLRYRPLDRVVVRATAATTDTERDVLVQAARLTNVERWAEVSGGMGFDRVVCAWRARRRCCSRIRDASACRARMGWEMSAEVSGWLQHRIIKWAKAQQKAKAAA